MKIYWPLSSVEKRAVIAQCLWFYSQAGRIGTVQRTASHFFGVESVSPGALGPAT